MIWPGRSPACCISSSGLTDTDAADGSAGVRRPATSGIAANRLKVTAGSKPVKGATVGIFYGKGEVCGGPGPAGAGAPWPASPRLQKWAPK